MGSSLGGLVLSPDQQEALHKMRLWWKTFPFQERQEFLLDGGAGTGKTTLASYFVKDLAIRRPVFAAYTAKAAKVMDANGMAGASTLHSLLYRPTLDADGRITGWKVNPDSRLQEADLIVLDECSMCPESIANDIRSFGRPILVLGDVQGQLPPPQGAGAFVGRTPDFTLQEPHRTIADSPIQRLAWALRRGGPLLQSSIPEARVEPLREGSWEAILNRDNQVIVGKNKTRAAVTRRARAHWGYSGPIPEPGEPLVCTRNNYREGFVNGTLATLWRRPQPTPDDLDDSLFAEGVSANEFLADLIVDGVERPRVRISRHGFSSYADAGDEGYSGRSNRAVVMDWAYAITCHKAQGDAFPNVVIIDDRFASWDRDLRRRWLYTAVTRATERVLILTTR